MHSLLPPRSIITQSYLFYPFELRIVLHEMLGYFDAQPTDSEERVSGEPGGASDAEISPPPYSDLRDLLFQCAGAVSRGDWQRSISLIGFLSERVSPDGDSSERVIAQFADSLVARVLTAVGESQTQQMVSRPLHLPSDKETQAAYLAFNQITPFIRFSHLTANQAILEALEGSGTLHIVDFEIMQGVQWPPLMQALAQRSGGPPRLRISGTGSDTDILEQTGNRLMTFAASLGLPFEFHGLHASSIDDVSSSMLDTRPDEALAVNCVLQLHRLCHGQGDRLASFLSMIHSMHPRVVTLAEREANYNQPTFFDRFTEAFRHYSALFDSLEAILPPGSAERINVERVWFRREIMSILAMEGFEMHGNCSPWKDLFKAEGFSAVPHSTFAQSQARLLLRLHYPSEGYQLREEEDCLLLGWRDIALFAVSAWN